MSSQLLFILLATQGTSGGGGPGLPPVADMFYEFNSNFADTNGQNAFPTASGTFTTVGSNTFFNFNSSESEKYGLLNNTTDGSTSIWFKYTQSGTNKIIYAAGGWTFMLRMTTGNDLYLMVYINGAWQYSTYIPITLDNWYNVGFSWNMTTKQFKYYLDGTLINTFTWTTGFGSITSDLLQIGYSGLSTGISIDKLRVYQNTVLEQQDFIDIYDYDLTQFS